MFQKDEYCILILGLDNAGKTTFLEQTKTKFSKNYKGMSLSKITTTVGLNIGTIDVGKARLMFWDLGGQEELQSLWDKYYAESHGVIYVIDSTDEGRLSESKEAFEKMISSEALEGVPLLVLANKQDVPDCMSVPDIKTAFSDCAPKIGKRDCLVQPCTALTGDGVNEAQYQSQEALVLKQLAQKRKHMQEVLHKAHEENNFSEKPEGKLIQKMEGNWEAHLSALKQRLHEKASPPILG
ncbi:ADP-ribosylation factor-related protein 1 [Lates japonicus]|uniref:ADP-ribosylation factor-related protein 1 n=1 Tax=Lates japonicus TaxID=270547 RepID=A0AAD3N6L7_LATJO|nr:ADP-ribosylation factor-related protein 1 [Lates japonicus]